jgi:hypothetical protein
MEENDDIQIRRGFNAGYMMEKLNPKLSQQLRDSMSGNKDDLFMVGFVKGAEEYNQETFFTQSHDVPGNIQDLDLDNLPDNDLGKGDRGFEP